MCLGGICLHSAKPLLLHINFHGKRGRRGGGRVGVLMISEARMEFTVKEWKHEENDEGKPE